MMSFAKIRDGKYYLDLAAEDYYLKGGEPDGIWCGSGASLLKLKGAVASDDLSNLLKGFSPCGKAALCQNAGSNHTPGWDLTFNAPKSVSVLWAAANSELRQKIQSAQLKAVKEAIAVIEEYAAVTRRGEAGGERENVAGLITAVFEHSTSRALDPHLHSHAIVANIAPRIDGSWGTIDSRTIMLWQKAAGMVYKVSLADSIRSLGFETELDGDAFSVIGISKSICQHFSKRSAQIVDALKERGIKNRSSVSGDLASLSTRDAKGEINRADLFQQWQAELSALGLSQLNVQKLRDEAINNESLLSKEVIDQEMIANILTEKSSVFTKQQAFFAGGIKTLEYGQPVQSLRAVIKNLTDSESTIELGNDWKHNELFTTNDVLEKEQSLINSAKYLGGRNWAETSLNVIEHHINNQSIQLSDEQKFAVHNVCTESHLAILQGSAGSGKSASMRCVKDIYESMGKQVVGASVARAAANNLEDEANIKSFTIARLIAWLDTDKPPISEGGVLIIDEAGQVGTFQLEQLMKFAKELNFKIILVGEDKQLDAIEHGGVLRYLSSPDVIGTTRVETIRRQNNSWDRQAVADFRDGYANQALAQYHKRGQLYFETSDAKAKEKLISEWTSFRHKQPSKRSMVIAQSWADVVELNNEMRSQLQSEGMVGNENVLVKGVVSERDIDVHISLGERVRFTKNDYNRNYTNGDLGTVTKVKVMDDGDIWIRVKLDSGRETQFMSSSYANKNGRIYITQAYAQTVYSSQGLTIDGDVFVYYTQFMDRAHSYVACSRHKDQAHIFVNAQELEEDIPDNFQHAPRERGLREALAKNMSRNNRPKLAVEHLSEEELATTLNQEIKVNEQQFTI
ncbi:relaxase domain-containing protein [Pseudoalteromonas sp. SG43-6]|uniref:MobF family relaxase n=1 Tax=Pseudoalteromonas sp. SG43-6 TaxID=2760967 RepID=UPI001600CEB4|nr:MobF family relaxase [Pseudoalteromonas sp. SG43-6]MBB1435721.1 relaxase domain-containing protein [Pseudoalteromonas sp. SG43-6]